jgi:plasmid stabilization system protein ParE
MRRVVFNRRAERDLNEIWEYISRDSLDAADAVIARVRREIDDLARMPGVGHRRADVKNPTYRFWSVYSYVVAYRFTSRTLVVVRVVHGAMNFKKLFKR